MEEARKSKTHPCMNQTRKDGALALSGHSKFLESRSENRIAFDNLIWPTFDTFIWPTLRPLFSSSSGGWCFRGPGGSGVLRSGFQDRV